MPDVFPFVTAILPCRNEEKFIAGCLDSIISSDYPRDRLEVLVIDGMSEDGTREILAGYTERHKFVRMLENRKNTTPCAFNLGIRNARGSIIIIMGMHASYASDYISNCVRYLDKYGVDNVGGVMVTVPRENTLKGKAIAQALSHKFGVGNSTFRTGAGKPLFVDTVFGGCYKKDVFEKVGMFNEALSRNQDIDLNHRLKKAGGRILLAPEITCTYYARSDMKSFLINNWNNGFYTLVSIGESHITPVSARHLVPLVFATSLIASAGLSIFFKAIAWMFLAIVCSYALAALYFSLRISLSRKDWRFLFVMPPVFAMLHASHGLGALYGVIHLLTSRRFWTRKVLNTWKSPVRD